MAQTIELDLDLEQYFALHEAARKKNLLLDDFINDILRDALNNEKFIESLKVQKNKNNS